MKGGVKAHISTNTSIHSLHLQKVLNTYYGLGIPQGLVIVSQSSSFRDSWKLELQVFTKSCFISYNHAKSPHTVTVLNITSIPHFLVLCFIMLYRYCIFCLGAFSSIKFKVFGNHASSKSLSVPFFQQQCAHFLFLCHILVNPAIFQTFPLLLYLLWWSVISDLWCYHCNYFGVPQTVPI